MALSRETDLAWLAGFWDGEGSTGIRKQRNTWVLTCQLSHTEFDSAMRVLEILKSEGVRGRGYTYLEKDPTKHRDAHHLRMTGMVGLHRFSELMIPYAVTKLRHWQIAKEWCEGRMLKCGVTEKGKLRQGGNQAERGYSDYEVGLALELCKLNKRGPADRARRAIGRIDYEQHAKIACL